MEPRPAHAAARTTAPKAQSFLGAAGVAKTLRYGCGDVIFTQGDSCEHVMYIQSGGVQLSVRSNAGREAVVAMLGPGAFFGEGCLAGQLVQVKSATAISAAAILLVRKRTMIHLLREEPAIADRFIAHMLTRNVGMEADLVGQLFNSSEKRLALTLLRLGRYGKRYEPVRLAPPISQAALVRMVGTTRSRVAFFLNKFKTLGFIECEGALTVKVKNSLLRVVLGD